MIIAMVDGLNRSRKHSEGSENLLRQFTCTKFVQLIVFPITGTGCTFISSTASPKFFSVALITISRVSYNIKKTILDKIIYINFLVG